MPTPPKSKWRSARRAFRWCRIALLAVVFAAVGLLLYLNRVGLPDFVKRPLIAELQRGGLTVRFANLRLRGFSHIVGDDLRLSLSDEANALNLSVDRAEVRLNSAALWRLRVQVEGLAIERGRFSVPIAATNAPPRDILIDNIQTELRFLPGDRWTLSKFKGRALGTELDLSVSISNVSELKAWQAAMGKSAKQPAEDWRVLLRDFLDAAEQMKYSAAPKVSVSLEGDLRDPTAARASVVLRAKDAVTPWGRLANLEFSGALHPSSSNRAVIEGLVLFKVDRVTTPWGYVKTASLSGRASYPLADRERFQAQWDVGLGKVASKWLELADCRVTLETLQRSTNSFDLVTDLQVTTGPARVAQASVTNVYFAANLNNSYPFALVNKLLLAGLRPPDASVGATPPVPGNTPGTESLLTIGPSWGGAWQCTLNEASTPWGSSRSASLSGTVSKLEKNPPKPPSPSDFWAWAYPYRVDWKFDLADFAGENLKVDEILMEGAWSAPRLGASKIVAALHGGEVAAEADLNVESRLLDIGIRSDIELLDLAPLAWPEGRSWLEQIRWEKPPVWSARLQLAVPPWEDRPENAPYELLPSLNLEGDLALGEFSIGDVPFESLATRFGFAKGVARIPDLALARAEGALLVDGSLDLPANAFRAEISSQINLLDLKPLFPEEAGEAFGLVQFAAPPIIKGVAQGSLTNFSTFAWDGRAAITNFSVKGEPFTDLATAVAYSNKFVRLADIALHRAEGKEEITASHAVIDVEAGAMYLTNCLSTMDPYIVTTLMGPDIIKAINPYRFKNPPTVRVNGRIPLVSAKGADIVFNVQGGQFHYWRFNLPSASGDVIWKGPHLVVTNIHGGFYGGTAGFHGSFDFLPDDSADFRFSATFTNADLSLVIPDLFPGVHNLEGALTGTLELTSGNTDDLNTWKGFGHADLRDGLLWTMPVFGVFSPILNSISPGLGNSKVGEGWADYTFDKQIISTHDLRLKAQGFRLKYDGSVSLDGELNARMEAQFFRDAWVVGRAFSAVLWPVAKAFESRVTGQLNNPKSEFMHIPKIVLFPFRPIQTIKELFPGGGKKEEPPKPE